MNKSWEVRRNKNVWKNDFWKADKCLMIKTVSNWF